MAENNETGSINPAAEVLKAVAAKRPPTPEEKPAEGEEKVMTTKTLSKKSERQ